MAPLVQDGTDPKGLERRKTLLVVTDPASDADLVRAELRDEWYVVGCATSDVWVAARSIRFDLVLVLGPERDDRVHAMLDAEVGLVPEAITFAPTPQLARWAVESAWARRF
jgi:hypothetical protein